MEEEGLGEGGGEGAVEGQEGREVLLETGPLLGRTLVEQVVQQVEQHYVSGGLRHFRLVTTQQSVQLAQGDLGLEVGTFGGEVALVLQTLLDLLDAVEVADLAGRVE